MTPEQIINQNLKVNIFTIIATFISVTFFIKKYHPVKIVNIQIVLVLLFLPFMPYWLGQTSNLFSLSCFQFIVFALVLNPFCAETPFFKHIPISKRFRTFGLTFGVSTALTNAVISFSLIPLTKYFGHYALWIVLIPVIISYFWAMNYLKHLEIKRGAYHNYPNEDMPYEDTALKEEDYDYEDLGDEYEPFKNMCQYSKDLLTKLAIFSKEENRKINVKLIEKAITFAKKWHDGQMRKIGNIPFYSHPLKVAEMVAERSLKTDIVIGAILHDVVEDSECTVKLIEEKFNKRIAQMVDRLTKIRFENGKYVKLSLEETLKRLMEVGDNEVLLIKQMDRQHNLETAEGLKPEKQKKMAEETTNYFIRLIAIIGDKLNIYRKFQLENKMAKSCDDILKKQKSDFF